VYYVHFSLFFKIYNNNCISVAVAAALVDLFDSRREQQLRQSAERGNQQLGQTAEISNHQLVQTAKRLKQQLRGRDGLGRNVPAGSHTEPINSGTCSEPVLQIMALQGFSQHFFLS
jgi:hypothetical protein